MTRGKNIGFIGLAAGMTTGWHLHFDISYSKLLESRPAHWPNLTKIKALKAAGDEKSREYLNAQADVQKEVMANYIDPLKFLKDNHGDTMQRAWRLSLGTLPARFVSLKNQPRPSVC